MGDETNGSGDGERFDHGGLETLGDALRDAGRGLGSFGSEYPYLETDEREVRRQRFGRIVALINSLWPRMDAAIKADKRLPITNHERDAQNYHIDRLFRLFDAAMKPPKEDE